MFNRSILVLFAICTLGVFASCAQAEETRGTGWEVTSTTYPTDLPPGGTGAIEVNVYNIGARASQGPVTVTDTLPPGIVATKAGDIQEGNAESIGDLWECSGSQVVTCINNPSQFSSLPRAIGYQSFAESVEHIGIEVKVETSNPETLMNRVTVAGGGAAAPASTSAPITVSSSPASSFGFQDSDAWFSNADGTVDTQAGSHPYEFTYSFDLNTEIAEESLRPVNGQPRDLAFNLPPGIVGNPTAIPQCTRQQYDLEECAPSTQIGLDIAEVLTGQPFSSRLVFPVYNLVPPPGIPAQFAFTIFGAQTFLDAGVRSGGDYGITEHVNDLVHKNIKGNRITIWGEPSDPSHNEDRFGKFKYGECSNGCSSTAPRIPLLTVPTSCTGPQQFTESLDAWETTGFGESSFESHEASDTPTGFTGCDFLGFNPSISVAPDTSSSDTPAGLTVDVHVPQEGLSTLGLWRRRTSRIRRWCCRTASRSTRGRPRAWRPARKATFPAETISRSRAKTAKKNASPARRIVRTRRKSARCRSRRRYSKKTWKATPTCCSPIPRT